ncbi:MAG: hypothetical protein HY595_03910 [Candidatus Omnitrophica bacterium]|nr:hypothetical protein [Candidatus Omnitrophota bacterium]
MNGRAVRLHWTIAALIASLLAGCGTTVKELRHHPQQTHAEEMLAAVLPHTKFPNLHYWIRVAAPAKTSVGLAVLPQRHIYLSEPLITQADEGILTALVAHGVAHHRLHHDAQRNALNLVQRAAFKAGGFFVPGLSQGHRIGGPLMEVALSAGQEPAADTKTVEYLKEMGRSERDWLEALEFLVAHGYTEQVGRIIVQREDFANRIASLREHLVLDFSQ